MTDYGKYQQSPETRAKLQAARAMLAALRPFARWARGIAEVDQPDAFTFQRLKQGSDDGSIMIDEVLADDFARVLDAIAAAEAAGIGEK